MYTLTRENDNLIKAAERVAFVEFEEDGRFKSKHDDIKVGRALLMSPFTMYYTWLTTLITEILEEKENYWKFKTENSIYTLTKEE